MNSPVSTRTYLAMAAALGFALFSLPVKADVISINYQDRFGFGFRDNSPVAPAPGNEATTLGAQRRAVLERAVDILASRLDSNTTIRVNVRFDDLGCGDRTILGQAGSLGLARNFSNAPETEVNFPY